MEELNDWIDYGFPIADSTVILYGMPQDFLHGEAFRLFKWGNDVVHSLSCATALPVAQRVMVICFRYSAFALELLRVFNRTFNRGHLLDAQWAGRWPNDPTPPPGLADLLRPHRSREKTVCYESLFWGVGRM